MLSTGRQNSWTHRPWHRLNFFLVALLSLSSPLVAATLVVEVGRLVGLVVEGLKVVDLTSTVLGRFKSRSKELRDSLGDSLGRLGACESAVAAWGTAGTGMNWRYGSIITLSPSSSLTSLGTLASVWLGLITGDPGTAATAIKDGGSTQPEGSSPPSTSASNTSSMKLSNGAGVVVVGLLIITGALVVVTGALVVVGLVVRLVVVVEALVVLLVVLLGTLVVL